MRRCGMERSRVEGSAVVEDEDARRALRSSGRVGQKVDLVFALTSVRVTVRLVAQSRVSL